MAAKLTHQGSRPVFIVDGSRTPFLKAQNKPGPFSASDLAVMAAKPLLLRQPFEADAIDEVVIGCVMPGPDEANIGRIIALRVGCPQTTHAWTVQRNCASGLQALDSATDAIRSGRSELVLCGGTEAMSHAPVLYGRRMVEWLATWASAKTFADRVKAVAQFRPNHLAPVIALLRGLSDPLYGLSMGQTAENLAYRFGISREEMDAYAVRSHQRLNQAMEEGLLDEIIPIFDTDGQLYDHDTGLRADSSLEKRAKLKPVFDRPFGLVTAGNSAQITDGAAMLILASEAAVKKHKLKVMGEVLDSQWAGLDPTEMGLGPVHASVPLLTRNQLGMADIDFWEINEAFAAQVLACNRAFADQNYCQQHLALAQPPGAIDENRLNIHGGGVSLGHPVGASGARIVLHLLKTLEQKKKTLGIATLCIGGGQGGAMLIRRGKAGTHSSTKAAGKSAGKATSKTAAETTSVSKRKVAKQAAEKIKDTQADQPGEQA